MWGKKYHAPHFSYINQRLTLTCVRCIFKIGKHHEIPNEINALGGVENTPSLAGRLRRPRKTGLAGINMTLLGKLKKFEAVPGSIVVH